MVVVVLIECGLWRSGSDFFASNLIAACLIGKTSSTKDIILVTTLMSTQLGGLR